MKKEITTILNGFSNNTLSKLGKEIRFMNESNGPGVPESDEMKSLFNNPADLNNEVRVSKEQLQYQIERQIVSRFLELFK